MDYEKKYKDALERARKWRDKSGMPKDKQGILEDIFPELAKSEDEKIRKEIRDFICWTIDNGYITKYQCERSNSWLVWLEKQGKQKPDEWSEEDKMQLDAAIHLVNSTGHIETTNWLKSLKDRVQLKQEWSEEDSLMIDETIYFIDEFQKSDRCNDENDMQNSVTCKNWLKTIEDRMKGE